MPCRSGRPGTTPGSARTELQGTEAGLRLETAFIEEWGAANQPRLRAYKFGALALLPLLVWLGWRSRKTVTTEPAMQAAAKVLRRPISAWLLLVLIGVPFFFPDAPLVLHQMALLLALVPVLRLLPQRVFEVLGRWPIVGTVLYLLYRLSILLLGQPLYYRLYTLGSRWSRPRCSSGCSCRRRQPARAGRHAGDLTASSARSAWVAVAALLVGNRRQRRRQRLARGDADRRGARQRLRGPRPVCRRERAVLDPQPAAGAARDDALPRDHAARRAAAGKHQQAGDVRGAGRPGSSSR